MAQWFKPKKINTPSPPFEQAKSTAMQYNPTSPESVAKSGEGRRFIKNSPRGEGVIVILVRRTGI